MAAFDTAVVVAAFTLVGLAIFGAAAAVASAVLYRRVWQAITTIACLFPQPQPPSKEE